MPDLTLRPSGLAAPREWSLHLRYHDCCGPTDYRTLCYVDEDTAREVIQAGGATWLFGDPTAAKPVERGADAAARPPSRFERLRGVASAGMTTDEIMALTRGAD